MMIRPNNGTRVTVLTSKNTVENIFFEDCCHCSEKVPVVGKCSVCGTDYEHLRTIDNYETGFLHYIFSCSGCPEDQRKAQKILKVYEVSGGNNEASSRARELTKSFL